MKRAWIVAVSVVAGIGLAQQSHAATVRLDRLRRDGRDVDPAGGGRAPRCTSGSIDETRSAYEERFLPVHADLQGDADDGERGERDRDSVACGRGLDTVLRDAFDTLRRNCERRRS